MRWKLVAVALDAEAIEVAVIGVLQHLGCDDTRHERPVTGSIAGCLNPDGHIYRDVEEKTKHPVGEPHPALAR